MEPAGGTLIWLLACVEDPETTTATDTEPRQTADDTGLEGTPTGDTGTEGTTETDTPWARFLEARDGFLLDLAVPILVCVEEQDTNAPVFHGCYDWHSAVHGTWALLALSRLTGDPMYEQVALDALDADGLAQELDQMQRGLIAGEIPYGFAWLLLLAREHELATGDQGMAALADEAELQLTAYVDGLSPAQAQAFALSDEYGNLSWTLLQLWEQAVWNGDTAQQAHWEDYVRSRLVPLDAACPLEDDASSSGFFPPCLHRARTILVTLPPEEAAAWSEGFLPAALTLTPRTQFQTIHQAGQNFSRSWGLWSIGDATGDEQYVDQYALHVATHMLRPEYWAEEYAMYAHWVAQFGVYGIALSYE
jgi:hypothetical protein